MLRLMATSATALALLSAPALAQDAAVQPGGEMWDIARQSAEGAGMSGVQNVQGAFVLQGVSETGMPVLMVVGPNGELLALATPIPPAAAGGASGQAGGGAAGGTPAGASAADAAPEPGEPAETGFMATQADPATPQAWDPVVVEAAMQQLELGTRGMAGQVSEPSQSGSGSQPAGTESESGSQ